jgi:FemAB-related protein (PEP-CTERM system-associated)
MTSQNPIEIVLCDDKMQDEWDRYVHCAASATFCHQFAWRAIIEEAYGHRTFYLLARRDRTVVGILPLVLVKSALFGASLASMPFLDYGGICAEDSEVVRSLLFAAKRLQEEKKIGTVELRQCQPIVDAGPARLDKVSMVLDLSAGDAALWRSLPAKVRNQVRKAEKSGLTLIEGGIELLSEFYGVFVVNMRDLGSPVHDKAFFLHLFLNFDRQARCTLIRDGQKTVGGLVVLTFKDTMVVPWASSLREYFSKCPNNLLYWSVIRDGCQRGFTQFDFGRSTIGSGTYEFKRQWGAQPRQLHWQTVGGANGRTSTTVSSQDGKFHAAVEVWKRLPIPVTRILGPRIRKYLTN